MSSDVSQAPEADAPKSSGTSIGERLEALTNRQVSWIVFAGFTIFTIWFTWPLLDHLQSAFYGGPGDATGGIASLREVLDHHLNPFAPGTLTDFSAPEGAPLSWTVNVASFSGYIPPWITGIVLGPVAALNLVAISGHIATAQSTFLLARKLTRRTGAAILAGWVFAFFPFMVINSRGHQAFIHGWVFIFILWRMLELNNKPNRANGLWAGVSVVIAVAWNPYFLLLGAVVFGTLVVLQFVRAIVDKDLRPTIVSMAWSLVPIVAYLFVVGLITTTAAVSGARTHTLAELTAFSARPYEYVIPDGSSPLFGHLTSAWLNSHIHGSNGAESTLYLGISVLLLALIGIVAVFMKKIPVPKSRATVLTLIVVSAVGFAFSAPPEVQLPIIGVTVKTPSYFVFHFSPSWRVYSRFVIIVMMGVALLSAYGTAWVTDRKNKIASILILVAIGGLVVVDLWQEKGERFVTHIGKNPLYDTLRKQPPGILAEYPMEPFGFGDYSAEFGQNEHGHPIINGWSENSPEGWRAATLTKLSDPTTASRLATLGVRYVYNEHFPIGEGIDHPGHPGPEFQKIAGNTAATLYRVIAKPAPSVIIGAEGFLAPDPGQTSQWLGASQGTMDVRTACESCSGQLQFVANSFHVPRKLEIVNNGKVVKTVVVPEGKIAHISAPITVSDRHADVVLRVTPGPEQISKFEATTDPRTVAILIDGMRFIPTPGN